MNWVFGKAEKARCGWKSLLFHISRAAVSNIYQAADMFRLNWIQLNATLKILKTDQCYGMLWSVDTERFTRRAVTVEAKRLNPPVFEMAKDWKIRMILSLRVLSQVISLGIQVLNFVESRDSSWSGLVDSIEWFWEKRSQMKRSVWKYTKSSTFSWVRSTFLPYSVEDERFLNQSKQIENDLKEPEIDGSSFLSINWMLVRPKYRPCNIWSCL